MQLKDWSWSNGSTLAAAVVQWLASRLSASDAWHDVGRTQIGGLHLPKRALFNCVRRRDINTYNSATSPLHKGLTGRALPS